MTPDPRSLACPSNREGALLRARVGKDRRPLQLFLKVTFSKILS
jgi:hypothetical protein